MVFDMFTTMKGSLLNDFYPQGWDLKKLDDCCQNTWEDLAERQDFWHKDFNAIPVNSTEEFAIIVGHEMAKHILTARKEGRKIAFILPVGPVRQYDWCAFFLRQWQVKCDHVYGFAMDDWADANGNEVGLFGPQLDSVFYEKLGELTVPVEHRNAATKQNLPIYDEKIEALKAEGAKLITVHGIGRALRPAFCEPGFAADFDNVEAYKKETYRLGAELHPLTIMENSFTTYRGNFTAMPCYANTVTMGMLLKSDEMIGGCSSDLSPADANWQGMGVWATLRYGPDMWVPCSFIPTVPGKFYAVKAVCDTKKPYVPVP